MEFSKANRYLYPPLYGYGGGLGRYRTRKDWRHEGSYYLSRRKKPYRQFGNIAVRNYKGELASGKNYKKVYDVMWKWN